MIIMKFGGSSIKNTEAMRRVAGIVQKRQQQQPLIVLSALGGVTDQLIRMHNAALEQRDEQIATEISALQNRHRAMLNDLIPAGAIYDEVHYFLNHEFKRLKTLLDAVKAIKVFSSELYNSVIGLGEMLSTRLFEGYLRARGLSAVWLDVRPVMVVEQNGEEITPLLEEIEKQARVRFDHHLQNGMLIVTQGFLATTRNGAPATLGRDGSDYTASLLGAALKVKEIQIWSDVDGILSADPTIIKEAQPLPFMTFEEACELAYFGARVLHPATIQPALTHGIPVRVLNSHFPDEPGTLIVPDYEETKHQAIKSIAYKENITLLTIESSRLLLSPKAIEDIFDILTRHGKKVYAVTKSATKLSVTIQNNGNDNRFLDDLKRFGRLTVEPRKTVVSVVGEGMKANPLLTWQIIKMLHEAGIKIELISQFARQISMMFIIDEQDIPRTVELIHARLIAGGG
ncbi:aspartate kinase [Caldithrix abyssi DSM 13497]|uniref:Aspartokinase n=1 Tax=Caldithrix abyssi DSM 13497 TaxID=880073 RepID=H1XWP4_CALAY|nr:aspartate kinase [Caldithrix abyssi]APF17812.1 aspartate kinase [Caldithrix abyssi DSM 13497]EHO41882.1 aspartate kinase [Caldithrix abyssi DSM 13497]